MDTLNSVFFGFQVALQPDNLFFCFLGALLGTLVGVLPGIGPVGAMALLMPITFSMSPTAAVIMFAGIYYGCQYGGSTTSILLNLPGESTSIVTCLDGYQMARQGRAGVALGIAAIGSFIAGTIGICGLILFARPLTGFALRFGPPEYFSLLCMGFIILTYLASGSMARALLSAVMGIMLAMVGSDPMKGIDRFTLGNINLRDGISIVPLAMGMFGISEILSHLEKRGPVEVYKTSLKGVFPRWKEMRESWGAILRGSVLGFFLGILPGGGAILSSFVSYAVEKKISKRPELFGTGVIQGVAAPESANNAGAQASFIPLMTLGIPTNIVMALLLGALMLHGVTPGPLMIRQEPNLFWGLISSMYIGNLMLLVLNLPLIGIWVRVLKVPPHILFPVILILTMVGVFTIRSNVFDIYLMIFFGVLGYLFKKFEFEIAPFLLAFVLGDMFEEALRQSLIMSRGDFTVFLSRPISAAFLLVALGLALLAAVPFLWRRRPGVGYDEG